MHLPVSLFYDFLVRINHRDHQACFCVLDMGKLRLTEGKLLAQERWVQEQNAGSQAASPPALPPAWHRELLATPGLELLLLSAWP